MEFDDIEPMFDEDDREEFERNQLVNDRECDVDDGAPSDEDEEELGDLID